MKERLQTCYKSLSLVVPAFINLNLELLHSFVHFWSSYSEVFVHYRELVGQIKRFMKNSKN